VACKTQFHFHVGASKTAVLVVPVTCVVILYASVLLQGVQKFAYKLVPHSAASSITCAVVDQVVWCNRPLSSINIELISHAVWQLLTGNPFRIGSLTWLATE
jgi:hypothetical protein